MKRVVCLLTAFAMAFQATGLALASEIPPPSLGEARRGSECSAGILPAPDHDDADRMIEMVDGTGTTEWTYVDADLTQLISPQGTIQYDYDTNARLETLTEVIPGGSNIVTTYTYDDAGRTETIDKFGETTTFLYDEVPVMDKNKNIRKVSAE